MPKGGGTGGSRSLQLGGAAVQQASRELLAVARERATATLEVSEADLVYDTDASAFSVKGDPDASVPLSSLAEAEWLFVRSVFTSPGPTFPFGTHVAVVEVAKGIGEAGSIGSTPAVQNAVIDAVPHLGVTHIDMPTSSQRVWRAINAAKEA